jgi:DNA repair protein RadD
MEMSVGRKAGVFFSASKTNAIHIRDAIRRHGRTCEALTSDNAHETDRIFRAFKASEIWAISSVNMITTGTNFPFVDFISLILSTKSAGKLVQILGRGTRNSPGKVDCLVSDHAKNLSYFGPIDQISPKTPGSGEGEQPVKVCPTDKTDIEGKTGCDELVPISRMTCHCCGYIFPPSEEEKITARPDIAPVLSTADPVWHEVTARTFREHVNKDPEKPPSVRVDYVIGFSGQKEWLCPQHPSGGFAKKKADKHWALHGGLRPFPTTVDEWLSRAGELNITTQIRLKPSKTNPRYQDVIDWQAGAANDNYPAMAKPLQGRRRVNEPVFSDDDIPF